MQFNTFLCSGTENFFIIIFFSSPHRLSNSMYDLSPESFKSLQAAIQKLCVWPMTDELARRSSSETALPWEKKKKHIALVSLQGWNSRHLEGFVGRWGLGGLGNKIIFYSAIWHRPPKARTACRSSRSAQLNSGRSLRRWQFVLAVSRLSWLSQGEPRSWPRAGGSHLRKLSRARRTNGEADLTGRRRAPTDSRINGGGKKGNKTRERGEKTTRRKVMSASGVTNCCHQGFFLFFRPIRNSPKKLPECGRAHLVIGYASKGVNNRS